MMKSLCAAYIMSNRNNNVLYVGSTRNLPGRTKKHKTKYYKNSFSARYNTDKLVYYELFESIKDAVNREKQIKAGSRQKKINLINSMNPNWKDLYNDL